jgi:hypothetical protein
VAAVRWPTETAATAAVLVAPPPPNVQHAETPQLAADIPVDATGTFQCPHCLNIMVSVLGVTARKWRLDGCGIWRDRETGNATFSGASASAACQKVSMQVVEEREAAQLLRAAQVEDDREYRAADASCSGLIRDMLAEADCRGDETRVLVWADNLRGPGTRTPFRTLGTLFGLTKTHWKPLGTP